MRHYNTCLFLEVAIRCLHQITSDKAIIDQKRGKFAQKFQFSFDITLHHFDFIMSESTVSELEIGLILIPLLHKKPRKKSAIIRLQ